MLTYDDNSTVYPTIPQIRRRIIATLMICYSNIFIIDVYHVTEAKDRNKIKQGVLLGVRVKLVAILVIAL